jgi:hypothetical protein
MGRKVTFALIALAAAYAQTSTFDVASVKPSRHQY